MELNIKNRPMASAPLSACLSLIDLERYPIHNPSSPVLLEVIAKARIELADSGCVRLPGFILPEAHSALAAETTALAPLALFSSDEYTPYGTGPDDSFSEQHPMRRAHRTTSGHVTRDLIPAQTSIQQIYANRALKALIAACLEAGDIHPFADPMRGLIINTMDVDNVLEWHYDANEFVVSLMTRCADQGGTLEYCPNLRAPGNENFDAVRSVLDGEKDHVHSLDLQVGDLQIFKGRYSLHRVNRIENGTRHTVIFGYARQPGFIGSVASTMKVYGRVMPEHIAAENDRNSDGLAG
ncbi:hypothetical protein [Sneathiella sp.]|uniref:HalD/BesD family halogenase n=1 Tax=Sneathiella sp. TaxID=1964365 RepID=UPI0035686B87